MRAISPAAEREASLRDRGGGFALYELILALAILGLVAGTVFPRVARPPGPAELRAKAEEVAALLRSDRNSALRGGRPVLSRFDLKSGLIASGAGGRSVELPSGMRTQLVQSSREARAGGGGIRFLPEGGSSGGALLINRGDNTVEVSVNWFTAGVLVSARGPASGGSGP